VGTSGSGKSTLARLLSKRFSLKHIELDTLQFLPGWVERPKNEFIADAKKAMKLSDWVSCGNFVFDNYYIFKKADLIVWLDYPFLKVFWQTIKRTFRRILFKEPCCNGNYETFYQQLFTKYSIFWWVMTTYSRRKREYTHLSQLPEFKNKWQIIQTQVELDRFLKSLKV